MKLVQLVLLIGLCIKLSADVNQKIYYHTIGGVKVPKKGSYKLRGEDGEVVKANVVKSNGDKITFKLGRDSYLIFYKDSLRVEDSVITFRQKDTLPRFEDPSSERYFTTPSAFMLKKGEFKLTSALLSVNYASVGVHDRVNLHGGLMFISGLQGDGILAFGGGLKLGQSITEKIHVAAGCRFLTGEEDRPGFNPYVVSTFGTKIKHLSLSYNVFSYDEESDTDPVHSFALSEAVRVGANSMFYNENVFIYDEKFGMGYMNSFFFRPYNKRFSADLGIGSLYQNDIALFPILNFSWKFMTSRA